MKKYYLHDGNDSIGPFDVEELKKKDVNKNTPVWFNGLDKWTTIGEIDELREIFNHSFPPPFEINKPNKTPLKPIAVEEILLPKKSKPNKFGLVLQFIGGIVICVFLIAIIYNYFNRDVSNTTYNEPQTYEEKIMSIEEIEISQPLNFLATDGNYTKNFLGNKIKINGIIRNNATKATYKDALIKITYYSKTKTELGNKEYRIYEIFPPQSDVKFELKVDNYKDVETIGWEVIKAKVN